MIAEPSCATTEDLSQSQGSLSNLRLTTIDRAGRAAAGAEKAIEIASDLASSAVTLLPHAAASLLPEIVAKPVHGAINGVEAAINIAGNVVGKGTFQGLTLGAPSWLQALRNHTAVTGAVDPLEANPNLLAHETADRLVTRVETFFKGRLGDSASEVMLDPAARKALKEKVALRLASLQGDGMTADDMARELRTITKELMSAFGVYQHGRNGVAFASLGMVGYAGYLGPILNYSLGKISAAVGDLTTWVTGKIWNGFSFTLKFLGAKVLDFIGEHASDALSSLWTRVSRDIVDRVSNLIPGVAPIFFRRKAPTLSGTLVDIAKDRFPILNEIPAPKPQTSELMLPNTSSLPVCAPTVPTLGTTSFHLGDSDSSSVLVGLGNAVTAPLGNLYNAGVTVVGGVARARSIISGLRGVFGAY